MSFISTTRVIENNQEVLFEGPLDKESNVHTVAVLNEGVSPNSTTDPIKVTLSLYDASEPATRPFAILEVAPGTDAQYTKVINIRPGDQLRAETDGGEVTIMIGAFVDEDTLVTSIFNITGQYDHTVTYQPYDVAYYLGSTYVNTTVDQTAVYPTQVNGGWTPLGSGFNAYGEFDPLVLYPPLSVVKWANNVYVTVTGSPVGVYPNDYNSTWISFTSLTSDEIPDTSGVSANVAASITILNNRLNTLTTTEVPEASDADLEAASGFENAYFTRARARESISVTGDLIYDVNTGVLSAQTLTQDDVNIFIDNRVSKSFVDALGVDADTVDGIEGTVLARTDISPTFSQNIIVSGEMRGDLRGNVLADDSSIIINHATKEINGRFEGTLIAANSDVILNTGIDGFDATFTGTTFGEHRGDVLSDDSNVIIDASSGLISGDLEGNVTATFGVSRFNDIITDNIIVQEELQVANILGNITSTGVSTFNNVDINGGYIDNAVINTTNITGTTIVGTYIEAQTGGFRGDILSTGTSRFNDLIVTGDLTFNTLEVQALADFKSLVNIDGGLTVGGTLNVTGGTTFGNINVTGGQISGVTLGSGSYPVDIVADDVTILNSFTATDVTAEFSTLIVTDEMTGDVSGNLRGNVLSQDGTTVIIDAFAGIIRGDLVGDTVGQHTGNVDGNVVGNVTGNVTAAAGLSSFSSMNAQIGDIAALEAGSLTVTGAASFTGDLTFDTLQIASLAVNNTLTVSGISTLGSVDIGGGTMDAVTIGGNVPASVTGTIFTGDKMFADLFTGSLKGVVEGSVEGDLYGNVLGLDSSIVLNTSTARATLDADVTGQIDATANGGGESRFDDITITGVFSLQGGGQLTGDLTGNVVGDVTGDVYASNGDKILETGNGTTIPAKLTGNVEGEVLGTFTGTASGDFTGDVFAYDSTKMLDAFSNILRGDLVGNVSGNVLGDLTGNVNTTGTQSDGFFRNLTVEDTLTFPSLNISTIDSDNIDVDNAILDVVTIGAGITTGTIDNTTIGATTPRGGVFTTLQGAIIEASSEFRGNIVSSGSSRFNELIVTGDFVANLRGDIIAEDSSVIVNNATKTFYGTLQGTTVGTLQGNVIATSGLSEFNSINVAQEISGTLRGDVVAPDSTLLIDISSQNINGNVITATGGFSGEITGTLVGCFRFRY